MKCFANSDKNLGVFDIFTDQWGANGNPAHNYVALSIYLSMEFI